MHLQARLTFCRGDMLSLEASRVAAPWSNLISLPYPDRNSLRRPIQTLSLRIGNRLLEFLKTINYLDRNTSAYSEEVQTYSSVSKLDPKDASTNNEHSTSWHARYTHKSCSVMLTKVSQLLKPAASNASHYRARLSATRRSLMAYM